MQIIQPTGAAADGVASGAATGAVVGSAGAVGSRPACVCAMSSSGPAHPLRCRDAEQSDLDGLGAVQGLRIHCVAGMQSRVTWMG